MPRPTIHLTPLARARLSRGITVRNLAALCGVPKSTAGAWSTGAVRVPARYRARVEQLLGIDLGGAT